MVTEETFDIQVPQGTIIQVAGCAVRLAEPLFIKHLTDNEFEIELHEVMDYDYFKDGDCE